MIYKGRPQVAQSIHLPAPLGGMNKVAPASALPEGDALLLNNMITVENGLRPRFGYYEHAIGFGKSLRSILPYTGANDSGSADKLFVATEEGLFDVTESTQTPASVLDFANKTTRSGYGNLIAFVTGAGRFALYCDEDNGYFVRSEAVGGFRPVVMKGVNAWQANHAYAVGDMILEAVDGVDSTFVCTHAGQSHATTEPTWAAEDEITDGTVTWSYRLHVFHADYQPDPAAFAQCVMFKERLLFVEKDSTKAWFTKDAGVLAGELGLIEFGRSFKSGGKLAGLYVWTVDGGAGIDDILVAVSTAGDVILYKGVDLWTDGLSRIGGYAIGQLPAGRRLAVQFGGDLFILSQLGLLPLSTLVAGRQLLSPDVYRTYKVRPLLSRLMATLASYPGWSAVTHPGDASLLITIPGTPSEAPRQLAMSLATSGWATYTGLPIACAASWKGKLYFGTADGRVCANDGYEDNITLDGDETKKKAVEWGGLTGFGTFGAPVQKQIHFIRPIFIAEGIAPACRAEARYDFNYAAARTPAVPAAARGWDVSEFATGEDDTNANAGVWEEGDPEQSGYAKVTQAVGIGAHAAVVWAGASRSPVSLVGFDLTVEMGGFL